MFMNSYEEWRKKRERKAILLLLIPLLSFFASLVLIDVFAPDPLKILRWHISGAILTIGMVIWGPRAMKEICNTDEELLWAASTTIGLSVLLFFMMHMFYLRDSSITVAMADLVLYISVVAFPSFFITAFLSYEIIEGRRVKRRMGLRLKRIFGRCWFAFMFSMGIVLVYKVFSLFSTNERVLLFAFIITELALVILTLQFRRFFNELMRGEW